MSIGGPPIKGRREQPPPFFRGRGGGPPKRGTFPGIGGIDSNWGPPGIMEGPPGNFLFWNATTTHGK